jgi:hypothetical protein
LIGHCLFCHVAIIQALDEVLRKSLGLKSVACGTMIQTCAGDVLQISMLTIPWRLQSLKQRDLLGAFF